jgi:tRNA (pseudouridine54-N1)-methyltransferase
MRRIVVFGRTAHASAELRLDDIPSSGGRLDVLLRCLRAGMLVSHGLRRDVVFYLVLGGPERRACALRIEGTSAQFIRPDERSLAATVQKALAAVTDTGLSFKPVKPGLAVSAAGADAVFADLPRGRAYVLDEGGDDIRREPFEGDEATFFVGDHLGFDPDTRARLDALGTRRISVGPQSIHAEDAIAVLSNELDRRAFEVAAPEAQRGQRA